MCGEWRQQGQSSLLVTLSLTGMPLAGQDVRPICNSGQDVQAHETGEARFCLSGSRVSPCGRGLQGRGRWRPGPGDGNEGRSSGATGEGWSIPSVNTPLRLLQNIPPVVSVPLARSIPAGNGKIYSMKKNTGFHVSSGTSSGDTILNSLCLDTSHLFKISQLPPDEHSLWVLQRGSLIATLIDKYRVPGTLLV